MTRPYNPYAFPSPGVIRTSAPDEYQQGAYEGMTLRDHFAGLAMQAMIAHDGHLSGDDKLAAIAYRVADAMLKQRDL